ATAPAGPARARCGPASPGAACWTAPGPSVAALFQYQLGIDADVEPAHPPVQVRPPRASRGADRGNHLALLPAVPRLHVDPRQVQEVAADAVPVVQQHGAAGEVEVGIGEGDDPRRRRAHWRARGRGDVHARVRRAGFAVVDAGTAEAAADAPFDRTDERAGEVGARVVAQPRLGHARLFAADAFGDRRRRI